MDSEKTAIFFHSDTDGVVSAVNVLLSFPSSVREKVKLFPLREQEKLSEKLRKVKGKFSQVFILDLVPPEKDVVGLAERVVIIDHHISKPIIRKGVVHLNPRFSGKPPYPVCYQTYILMGGRDWQTFVGVVSDWAVSLLPLFVSRMWKPYGWVGTQENLYFFSDAGRINLAVESAVILYGEEKGALLALKAFLETSDPKEFLEGKGSAKKLLLAAEKISKEISNAVSKGPLYSDEKLEIYELKSKYDIKREVIQRLKAEKPKKYVLVYFRKGKKTSFSVRGPGMVPQLISPYGGGHPEAGGGTLPSSKLEKFLLDFRKRVGSL